MSTVQDSLVYWEGGVLPKPYYQDESCTIYHGDTRLIMPLLPMFDLVLMDPPYGMAFQSNHRFKSHLAIKGDEVLPVELIIECIAKAKRAAYVFCRWDNLVDMPKPKSCIAWVKNNWSMGDLKHEHGRQWEACCFYPKADHVFKKRIPDVILADRVAPDYHPTPKPEAVMRILIGANEGDTILDPFMGSGTTLISAKLEGRRAVGIEFEEKYCESAAKRLQQGLLF